MSRLKVGTISTSNPAVTFADGVQLSYPGRVVQVITCRTDTITSYYQPANSNGTTLAELNLTITPKYSSSLLLMQWMINGETGNDNVFLIHQNGSLITTAGYEGYNGNAGNQRWSGYVCMYYDRDTSSTGSNYYIQYAIPATNLNQRTYAPAVRNSGPDTSIFTLNRTYDGRGQDNYEIMVSTGMIMEIQQ